METFLVFTIFDDKYEVNCLRLLDESNDKSKINVNYTSYLSMESTQVLPSSGIQLRFSESPATRTLLKWSKEIDSAEGTVSHMDAVRREQYVVHMIDNGKWPLRTYSEYQHMAAGSGNVDSFRLLMQYALDASVAVEISTQDSNRHNHSLHIAVLTCNLDKITNLLHDGTHVDSRAQDGTVAMVHAAYVGCLQAVKYLVMEGADVEANGAHGVTPLMAAAGKSHVDIVRYLVTTGGAVVDRRHKFSGNTALHMAAEMDAPDVVTTLCELGADVNARTTTGGTPLHTAADVGASHAIAALLSAPCRCFPEVLLNNDTTPLYLAAQNGHAAAAEALLTGGAEVSFAMPRTTYAGSLHLRKSGDSSMQWSAPVNSEAGNGAEALHAAAENGHTEVVRLLLRWGADVNSVSMGASPLVVAAQHNQPHTVRALLEANANTEILTSVDGATALYYATGRGLDDIVTLLLDHGADCNVKQRRAGGFPLLYAILSGHDSTSHLLLSRSECEVTLSSTDGTTALHAAVSSNKDTLLSQILARGADVAAVGVGGRTSLHYAVEMGSVSCLQVLLSHIGRTSLDEDKGREWLRAMLNARLDDEEGYGSTPLLVACRRGDVDAVRVLLGAGADPYLTLTVTGHNASSLYLAVQSGSVATVRLVMDAGIDPDIELSPPTRATPLLKAIETGNVDVVRTLLEGVGTSSNAKRRHVEGQGEGAADPDKGVVGAGLSQSPLLLATVRRKPMIVRALLDAGANCGVEIGVGGSTDTMMTLLDIAKRNRDFDTMQILASHPACTVKVEEL
eukprot:gene155-259_t